jgi:hypothetical protein
MMMVKSGRSNSQSKRRSLQVSRLAMRIHFSESKFPLNLGKPSKPSSLLSLSRSDLMISNKYFNGCKKLYKAPSCFKDLRALPSSPVRLLRQPYHELQVEDDSKGIAQARRDLGS